MSKKENPQPLRVAIYTRTSSAERLNKEVNSIDVQREYCESIAFRDNPDCTIIPRKYDDGGFSGKDGDRFAYEELSRDVQDGLVDVVYVYMVDRIGRNEREFHNYYQFLQDHGVNFKSATEPFDSTTPEGEMMMSMLMNQAQYFRKSTARRIRDSIAAAKSKGKYTGGRPLAGYDIDPRTKRLVINEREAESIRFMFNRFIETGSSKQVAREMCELGYTT